MEVLFESGDIETFKELFCFVVCNNKTKEENVFVISRFHNDLQKLLDFITDRQKKFPSKWFMFSYNGNKFDWIVINYLIKHQKNLLVKDQMVLVKEIYYLNKKIQQHKDDLYKSDLKSYMYNYPFHSIDLMCFWTISTIKSKNLSLKFFEVSLDLSVEECPINWEAENITEENCETIVNYCRDDVNATIELANKLREKVNSRFDVIKEYSALGYDLSACLSWDDVKIGYETLLRDIAKENNIRVTDIPNQTLHESVKLLDVIIPELVFDSIRTGNKWYEKPKVVKKGESNLIVCFDNFSDMLDYLKTQVVTNTTSLSLRVTHNGIIHDIKSGGLHSYHDAEIRMREKGFLYKDIDVSSYYPTLGAEQNFVPQHLKQYKFADIIKYNKNQRIKDKLAGRIGQANIKKLKLNGGFYGNTNVVYRKFYDWFCTLQITINGQLLLLKNIEMQTKNLLIKEDMCNTDGITYYFPESELDYFNKTNKEWEILAKVELEEVNYELVVKDSINSYVAFYYDKNNNIKTKEKGTFNTNPEIDASKSYLIIPKILNKYFKHKFFYNEELDIETEVKNHPNIYDFCSSAKINKDYEVFFKTKKVQQLNRCYVSKNGHYLFKKRKQSSVMLSVPNLKGIKVKLLNKATKVVQDSSVNNYDIDYNYYVRQIKEDIEKVVTNEKKLKQLTLF